MKTLFALTLWVAFAATAPSQELAAPASMTVMATAPAFDATAPEEIPESQNALLTTEVPAPPKPLLERLTDGTFVAELFLIFGAMLAFLRGLAECLTRLSVRFPGASKPAKLVSDASWILGSFIGKWGHGEPKLVTEEKAKVLVQQGVVDGSAKAAESPKAG